jgi:outer membrane protein OmpA-like peptidoglycan-associated protein
MSKRIFTGLLILAALVNSTRAQQSTYTITKAPFSSDLYDEFSPVWYTNGIVFTTNRSKNSISSYSDSKNKGQFKIFYIDTTDKVSWKRAGLFSKDLRTVLNDGPVTFSKGFDTVYYSRNLKVEGNISTLTGPRNKLGIFSAVFDGKHWTKIREFRFNNEWYNVTTPWLSPDGKRLYFASDKNDGFGGSDLYYSEWRGTYWDNPVNLGPVINTKGNEAYPFINQFGELFFASDGHPGLGGKDIFFSRQKDNAWLPPVRLDPPVNSVYDDFGMITDAQLSEGYFTSNRDKSIDIYRFKTNLRQFFYSELQRENQYCFMFSDESDMLSGNNTFQYEWEFGDGTKGAGQEVVHCYSGPGKYPVKLNITDRKTGIHFFNKLSYILDLRDVEQPYINSSTAVLKGESVSFDGLRSNLPGYEIVEYLWDFGDGTRGTGTSVKHTFNSPGEYLIKLGLSLKQEGSGAMRQQSISRKISVFESEQERSAFLGKTEGKPNRINIREYDQADIEILYSADEDLKKDALFDVEIINSKTRLDLNSSTFRNVPSRHKVKEIFSQAEGRYRYIVDSKMNLSEVWLTYNEMRSLEFNNTVVRTSVITDPVEKELHNLKKIYGLSSDTYFDANNRLTSTAYLFLDQLSRLLLKYPGVKLEVEVHTENGDLSKTNLALSQQRARLIVSYFTGKGFDSKRLIANGLGGTRPVASNLTEAERKLNRRIDFILSRGE